MPIIVLLVVIALAYAVSGTDGTRRESAVSAAIGDDDDRWAGCSRPPFWHPDYKDAARECAADRAEMEK